MTWRGAAGEHRDAVREILDLELNTRTFFGAIEVDLDWTASGEWRILSVAITRTPVGGPLHESAPEDGWRIVRSALERGGLSVAGD